MLETFLIWLDHLSTILPLPLFVLIGSFLEEIVAPIPSPLIMSTAGTLIKTHGHELWYILYIAAIGAFTKTIASLVLYYVSDKAEDMITSRKGKWLGISPGEIENIGKYFNDTKRDGVLLFILRAIPAFPNGPVSILCGVIKIDIRTYVFTTFFGTLVKNLFYIYAGILSLDYLQELQSSYPVVENWGYFVLFGAIIYFTVRHLKKRK